MVIIIKYNNKYFILYNYIVLMFIYRNKFFFYLNLKKLLVIKIIYLLYNIYLYKVKNPLFNLKF